MHKLRPDGTSIRVEDLRANIDWSLYGNDRNPDRINIDAFFNKNMPNDILLYELKNLKYALPIDQKVVDLLSNVETVKYKFINCLTDAPQDNQSVNEVEIHIKDIRNAIEMYCEWCIYNMINYLPYADFAIDHMPTIDIVYINGVESNLFENITKYLNDILNNTFTIDIFRDGIYKTYYDKYSIEKDKKIYMSFYRVNSHYPIFYSTYKYYRKAIKKLDHIEITLRWYNGKYNDVRDYTVYAESIADDYMYCDTTLESNLTLAAALPYLYEYYTHELKYMKDNHFLITVATIYYKTKMGLCGFEVIDPNSKFIISNILESYCKFLDK